MNIVACAIYFHAYFYHRDSGGYDSAFINPAIIVVILNGVKEQLEKARFFASLRMTSLQCLLAGLIGYPLQFFRMAQNVSISSTESPP
jgi:hypothetical protein